MSDIIILTTTVTVFTSKEYLLEHDRFEIKKDPKYLQYTFTFNENNLYNKNVTITIKFQEPGQEAYDMKFDYSPGGPARMVSSTIQIPFSILLQDKNYHSYSDKEKTEFLKFIKLTSDKWDNVNLTRVFLTGIKNSLSNAIDDNQDKHTNMKLLHSFFKKK